jgi:hypothetical protein
VSAWWRQTLRSTFTYGYVNVSNLDSQSGESLDTTNRFTSNFTWSPIPRVDLVIEYLGGDRRNKDGSHGFSNQFQLGGIFRF